jgi:hypothetical protein
MPLSWNEIKDRAVAFSKDWEGTFSEDADAKPFLVDFFNVFGLNQRKVAAFEHKVKKLGDSDGYIDMLWKGWLLIEMKSKGKDLTKAFGQAKGYIHGLKPLDIPKYVLVCDFETFRLYDLEENEQDEFVEFKLDELVNHVELFGFIAGYQKKVYREEDPVNVKAAELMGKLHDRLQEIGYEGHPLEVYLVRLLFCLFAEDTSIFNKQQFQDFIEERTCEDGSDLAAKIQEIFQLLNTPLDKRFKNLDEQLDAFPFVGGKLFLEILPTAHFDSKMRQTLLECCYLDWSKISPAIFGSMFQSVMDPKERRNLGAHYTSEKNILKLIKPLFLDNLWKEFESIRTNKAKLNEFHLRLSKLKFLDPACGCGNFLVITYRELRLLELAILQQRFGTDRVVVQLEDVALLNVDMMAGIEYEEFPARIAEVAMWLMDHQMNLKMSMEFGQYFARLPLLKSAKIVQVNALRINWEDVVSKTELNYIIGNPPFIGRPYRSEEQRADHDRITAKVEQGGDLDYVSNWFILAAQYIQGTKINVAFVSTNSICQGVQISLWDYLMKIYKVKIHFAYQTFNWRNDARGNAAVHCVLIGFANYDIQEKKLFLSPEGQADSELQLVKNISPYLTSGSDIVFTSRSKPICNVKQMVLGSQPTDDGNFMFNEDEKREFVNNEPNSEKYFRKVVGSVEFINNLNRYCLWLVNASPSELNTMPLVLERIQNVKNFRSKSSKAATRKDANRPKEFQMIRHNESNYLLMPRVSSENRKYVPIGFLSPEVISTDANYIIPNASLYDFGILISETHMLWLRLTAGKLKSDFRYSARIVYNNYPWPENPSEKQIEAIEKAAQKVLDARIEFPNSSLADLYNPLTMPQALIKAHNELDKAVDLAYRSQPFTSSANRMAFLFELYEKYTAGLFVVEKKRAGKK